MELSLAANIRESRKKQSLTQEQLADVMGVTTGAVYKWEAGLSVPELELIVKLAYFFDVSVDALLGCKPIDIRLDATVRRLKEYCVKADPQGVIEAESALGKYPNSFEVVYNSAELYYILGREGRDEAKLRRALELFELAFTMLPQNTDPDIGEKTIYRKMCAIYVLSGEPDKGAALMMDHNDGGIFSDAAGLTLAMFCGRCEEAEPYLTDAMCRWVLTLMNMVGGCIFVFRSREDWASARDMLIWSIELLNGLKKAGAVNLIDKVISEFSAILACANIKLGNREQALADMQKAVETARRFDAQPEYSIYNIRFAGKAGNMRINDVLGTTAAQSIESILGLLGDKETLSMWRSISDTE